MFPAFSRYSGMRHCVAICIFMLLLASLGAAAQGTRVKVGGVVTDEEGRPIEMAVVRLEGTATGTVCNLRGRYSLTFESRDSVTVVFSMLGHQTRKRLLVKPKGNIRIDMTLPSVDFELGEVSIEAIRRQDGTMQRLEPGGQGWMPDASGGNLETMVALQAGASRNDELSMQYNVRGGSFDENLVYVNGTEVYRPLLIRAGQQEGLSFINQDMVESVGFSTGGYDSRYGDKMSSVLDITYKRPQRLEGRATASLLGASAYVGWGNGRLSWSNGLRYKTNRYLLGTLDTKGEYSPRFLDYQTYVAWSPSRKLEAGFIGNVSDNRYDFTPEDRYTRFGTLTDVRQFKVYFDGQERDLFQTFFGSGHLTWRPGDGHELTLRASAFHTRERVTYDIAGQYWLSSLDPAGDGEAVDDEGSTSGIGTYMEHARDHLAADVQALSLAGTHTIGRHRLQWGLDMKHEHVSDRMREWELRDSAGYSLPQSADGPRLYYSLQSNSRTDSRRYGFYLQDTYKFHSRAGLFTLTAGLRGSYWDWNREFILSPRASLSLIPAFNEGFTFRLAAGVYYQAPFYKEFRDTTQSAGVATVRLNRDIRSQRALHFVAGGDYGFRMLGRPFRFSLEAYYKALDDLIPYNIDNVRISYYGRNLSRGYAVGVDMKLFGEFVPGTDSWLSLSLMKTEEKLNGRWLPRPTDQRYRLSLYFTDYFPGTQRWKMSLMGVLSGGLPFGPPHSGREAAVFRTSPYRRVDIGMSYCIIGKEKETNSHNLWIGIDIFNLLNISNVNSYYWVAGNGNAQYAVPNYLTSRQFNIRLLFNF